MVQGRAEFTIILTYNDSYQPDAYLYSSCNLNFATHGMRIASSIRTSSPLNLNSNRVENQCKGLPSRESVQRISAKDHQCKGLPLFCDLIDVINKTRLNTERGLIMLMEKEEKKAI